MQIEERERPFRLRPRRSSAGTGHSKRIWASGLRALLRFVQLSGFRRRKSGGSSWAGGRKVKGRGIPYKQRCAVRVTYSRSKTAGQWKAHGRYLARESATQKRDPRVVGFNAGERDVDIARRLDAWQRAGDERFFKLIISPEFGERMNLAEHTRALMRRIERDLGTNLEWAGVIHCNTDHPHVHVVLRGVDEQGRALRLPREYIRSGIRSHAEDLATEQLGHRTEGDAMEAQRREIHRLRFTTLDRIIQRSNPLGTDYFAVRADPTQPGLRPFAKAQQHHLAARLAMLEKMGLAENLGGYGWRVKGDFEHVLRMMQTRNDRQKTLAEHGALLSDRRLPLQFVSFRELTQIEGRVVAHGQEENTGQAYLMVEGVDGKVYLLYQNEEIQNARHKRQLGINSFARLEKRFSHARPFLQIEDLGNAYELLKNSAYLRSVAGQLMRRGIVRVDQIWGGWLGQYQKAVNEHLRTARPQEQSRRSRERAR
jgi:type IV secretory pathway VirD2 relaxase